MRLYSTQTQQIVSTILCMKNIILRFTNLYLFYANIIFLYLISAIRNILHYLLLRIDCFLNLVVATPKPMVQMENVATSILLECGQNLMVSCIYYYTKKNNWFCFTLVVSSLQNKILIFYSC